MEISNLDDEFVGNLLQKVKGCKPSFGDNVHGFIKHVKDHFDFVIEAKWDENKKEIKSTIFIPEIKNTLNRHKEYQRLQDIQTVH